MSKQLEVALSKNYDPGFILTLIPDGMESDLYPDLLAYALNTQNRPLEELVISKNPMLLQDPIMAEKIWIYCQIYDRPDLEAKLGSVNPSWDTLLSVGLMEDVDSAINDALNHDDALSVQGLIVGLIAAYRMGDSDTIEELELRLGSDWSFLVSEGYFDQEPPDASIPYRVLFQKNENSEMN